MEVGNYLELVTFEQTPGKSDIGQNAARGQADSGGGNVWLPLISYPT